MIFKFTICKNPFLLFGLVANINGNRCEHLPAVVNYKILKVHSEVYSEKSTFCFNLSELTVSTT